MEIQFIEQLIPSIKFTIDAIKSKQPFFNIGYTFNKKRLKQLLKSGIGISIFPNRYVAIDILAEDLASFENIHVLLHKHSDFPMQYQPKILQNISNISK